ncbi:hypothetical protein NP493_464g02006 [Ridgeia piscesae]|uniref:Uncharacterized protein n=1 Tax=Ridgeia piscesae TaxID=27915 RepID=A0AAD9KYE7_RIDPI|nr:hypothetical protein NP493_464g02006 [Ridgeia piscesae]
MANESAMINVRYSVRDTLFRHCGLLDDVTATPVTRTITSSAIFTS